MNFIFKDGDTIIYDAEVESVYKDGFWTFCWDEATYQFKLEEEVIFRRITKDGCFSLSENSCTYKLNDIEADVEIKVEHFKCEKNNNFYCIEYNIESDEFNRKKIILSFL